MKICVTSAGLMGSQILDFSYNHFFHNVIPIYDIS